MNVLNLRILVLSSTFILCDSPPPSCFTVCLANPFSQFYLIGYFTGTNLWSNLFLFTLLVGTSPFFSSFVKSDSYTCIPSVFAGGCTQTQTFRDPSSRGDNGPATSACLYNHYGLMLNAAEDTVFIGDTQNNAIRAVNLNSNIISHFAGGAQTAYVSYYADISSHTGNGLDKAHTSVSMQPYFLYADTIGTMYFVDYQGTSTYGGGTIRKIATNGLLTLAAGNGLNGAPVDGEKATSSKLNIVLACAVDSNGDLFLSDSNNHKIRKVTRNFKLLCVQNNRC